MLSLEGERRDIQAGMMRSRSRWCQLLWIDIGTEDAATIRDAIGEVSEILVTDADKMIPRPDWWPTAENRRKKWAIAKIEEIIRRVHEERRRHKTDRGDLFSHMVFVEDELGPMSDKQLRDEAMTLIFAGHETTAHALTWTWYLAKNPDKVAKLREARRVPAAGGRGRTLRRSVFGDGGEGIASAAFVGVGVRPARSGSCRRIKGQRSPSAT
jgi:hypothetical protein